MILISYLEINNQLQKQFVLSKKLLGVLELISGQHEKKLTNNVFFIQQAWQKIFEKIKCIKYDLYFKYFYVY